MSGSNLLTYHLPLQQEIYWLFIVDPIWLVWHTYISHSLTHPLTVHNIPDAPTKRYFFYQNHSKAQISENLLLTVTIFPFLRYPPPRLQFQQQRDNVITIFFITESISLWIMCHFGNWFFLSSVNKLVNVLFVAIFISHKRKINLQWNPDFSNPHFLEPPDNSTEKSFPSPWSNTVISLPDFSQLPPIYFSSKFSFPLAVRKIGIPMLNSVD